MPWNKETKPIKAKVSMLKLEQYDKAADRNPKWGLWRLIWKDHKEYFKSE